MLTFLSENPDRLADVKTYIDVTDFVDEPYHSVAEKMFDQIETSGTVDAAGIVGMYSESIDQAKVAGIFHKEVSDEDEAKTLALKEVVKNIMQHSLD